MTLFRPLYFRVGNNKKDCEISEKWYRHGMTTINEIEACAMTLPDQQRAELASHLLNSIARCSSGR